MSNRILAKDLPTLVGTDLEPSEWLEITQERVNQFAEAPNDFQFIHVDPERAAKTPFGGPVSGWSRSRSPSKSRVRARPR